ncbi:amino acid adenylation domain-containing protein [Cyanobium sp. ATX 6A2]|uniref:non-ribosomal peptide synthetase n=1 Tax=Cyanobium sp. ATX 6A2 TaxID=2823700 RepID=UPI0020CC8F8D|nr:amino acid adenylation domain-containing protein [Cyanobium sp. ATX 6A2]MCP9888741.1 amino acid adenylation domain-containing protein [Cyanobium sp. ATX 6A2]
MTAVQVQAFPASYAQSRLWFLQQLEPGLTAYHMPRLWRLRGALDMRALERALGGLIERHATLRTSFRLQGSEVLQIIHPPGAFVLATEELGERNSEAVIEEWLEEERSTPFDLTSGVLLRARLLQVTADEHVLLVNHHHIASDGWSQSVLARDLTELYNAHCTGRSPELAPLRVQYQDYAAWQRQRLSGERLRKLTQYWSGELEGLEPLELPGDRGRPAMPSHRGGSVSFAIGAELLGPFEELCRREGATLQMGLVAVVALLLHRYSRQEDVAIGVPIWGRNHSDLEALIGFFINTLPVRTRFAAGQSFRELLAQVRERSIGAYEHQELPFEQMVEALEVERDTSRNPLVQVMVQLMELPGSTLQNFADLEVESLSAAAAASRFDLEFFLRRRKDGGIQGNLVYARDLFDGERIERLSRHLITLLSSALQTPDAAAETLNLLPEAERELIESWQEGPRIEVPEVCVHQLFEQQVERTPEATALVFEDQELSYAELNGRANQLAHHLRELGVGPEVIVGVCLERSVELIVSLLAVLKAGGAYLPLDPEWPDARRQLLLKEAGGQVLINQEGLAVINAPLPPAAAASMRPLAYVTYTSGSTGTPKGVAIEHRSILRLVDPVNGFQFGAGSAVLQLAPVAFDAATFEIWGPLLNGGTLVVAPAGKVALPELAELLTAKGITTLWLTAGLFNAMVDSQLAALAGVRQVLAGGDVLSVEHVRRLLGAFPPGHELINGYGPTENTTFTSCKSLGAGELLEEPWGVPLGRPIAMTAVQVLDDFGHPCPIGVPGELHIGGAGLARGYLNQPELTAEKFIPDPFSSDPTARLYKSGDLASWNPDGTLAFHGRMDEQIKLRGFRIEPGEIEANLLAHPGVSQAVVVMRQDDPSNPRLIGYWVGKAAAQVSGEELRSFLAERLPEYMVPAALFELKSLPLTSNGKLDRKALPEPSFAGDLERRVEPTTELERMLHEIWTEVLGHGEFGITDNFFAVGGHSLLTMQLKEIVDAALGVQVPVARYFSFPTINAFSEFLQKANGSKGLEYSWHESERPGLERLVGPAQVHQFVEQQLTMLAHWPGLLAPGHQFIRTIGSESSLPSLFWCFQGADEFEGLAGALMGAVRVHGMRSAHELDNARQIYFDPALLYEVAGLYAREILEIQPSIEPFVIGGNCQAGIIANAIAWHLVAHGRSVRTLILMEPSMWLIQQRVLCWSKGTVILYGTDSFQNPFRAPSGEIDEQGTASIASRQLPEEIIRRSLRRSFGRGSHSVSFIPGVHGAFFQSSNLRGLADTIKAIVLS